MMGKSMFYQRQREFSRELHIFLACLVFILAVIPIFPCLYLLRDKKFINLNTVIADLPPNMLLYMAVYMIFCVAVFNFVKNVCSRGRRITCEKFECLSLAEKQEINSELYQNFKIFLFGNNNFYYCDNNFGFLHFIKYSDIVWVFKRDTAMIAVGGDPNVELIQTSYNLSSLVIYDINGRCFTARTEWETEWALNVMKKYAPNALFGFSKNRLKLAKKDFDLFKIEGKNIG